MNKPLLTITKSAGNKIAAILAQSPDKPHFRVQIKSGGCNGFEYRFGIDSEIRKRDLHQVYQEAQSPFIVLVDRISYQYIKTATIDYCIDANGERFTVSNPEAQTTCSCGSSFAPPNKE